MLDLRLLPLLVGSLLLASCSVGSRLVEAAEEEEDTMNVAQEFSQGKEARAWIADPNTVLFEISKDQGREITERAYAAGSPKVVISDASTLTEDNPMEVGSTFIIQLPKDPTGRKKIFDLQREIYGAEDGEKDTGQTYLVIATD